MGIAAMEAGAAVNESLTYAEIPNAVDVTPKLTYSETIKALQNGELVLTAANGKVQIQQDINTFKTFTPEKPSTSAKTASCGYWTRSRGTFSVLSARAISGKSETTRTAAIC
ncbi:hypothetical protein HMSSN036_24830 [Paenibacillus macerans]|nr:hypothetical protein HMSSN036_24830 [Paenibacillus macerans]